MQHQHYEIVPIDTLARAPLLPPPPHTQNNSNRLHPHILILLKPVPLRKVNPSLNHSFTLTLFHFSTHLIIYQIIDPHISSQLAPSIRSINQSFGQCVNEWINQSINESIDPPIIHTNNTIFDWRSSLKGQERAIVRHTHIGPILKAAPGTFLSGLVWVHMGFPEHMDTILNWDELNKQYEKRTHPS